MSFTFILKVTFVALSLYLILTTKKTGIKPFKGGRQLKEAIDRLFENRKKKGCLGKLLEVLDVSIQSSNIQKYIPFMDLSVFIVLTLTIFILVAFIGFTITGSIPTSFFMGLMSGLIPKVVLDIMSASNTKKIRRLYLSFLNAFDGFYNISGDIIHALDRSAYYTTEPLQTFLKKAVLKYNRSNAEFTECLDDLEKQIKDREFRKFIKFTKLHLVYGGDYRKALRKLIEQARRLESSRAMLAASSLSGTIIISGVIVLDLVTFFSAYTMNPETAHVLRTTFTGQMISLGNLLAMGIGVYIITSLNRG
jgi:tight adherence protein B